MGGIGFPTEMEIDDDASGYVIREIVVEVHQKKDHPYEHGHYDALVRLNIDMLSSTDPVVAIANLFDLAQEQVQAEIGQWLEAVEGARAGELLNRLYPDPQAHRGEIAPSAYPTMDENAKAPHGAPERSHGLSGAGQDRPGRRGPLPRPYIEAGEIEGMYSHHIRPLMSDEETVAQKMARCRYRDRKRSKGLTTAPGPSGADQDPLPRGPLPPLGTDERQSEVDEDVSDCHHPPFYSRRVPDR